MLKPQVNHLHRPQATTPPLVSTGKKYFIAGDGGADTSFLSHNTLAFPVKRNRPFCSRRHSRNSVGQIKAVAGSELSTAGSINTISLKAEITVKMTVGGVLSNPITGVMDNFTDMLGKSLLLELVAAETDSTSSLPAASPSPARLTGAIQSHRHCLVASLLHSGDFSASDSGTVSVSDSNTAYATDFGSVTTQIRSEQSGLCREYKSNTCFANLMSLE